MKKVSTLIAFTMLAFAVVATNVHAQTPASNRLVVSPYYQADGNGGVYTFIGVSHPSLSGAVSQIGLRLTAVNSNATANAFIEFTVAAGGTQRVFIVNTNNTTLNPTNLSDSNTSFIAVSTGTGSSGSIRAVSSYVAPINANSSGDFNNLSQLSFWGAIVAASSSSGFAMEFIGDAHDSVSKVEPTNSLFPGGAQDTVGGGYGRGIN